MDLLTHLFLPLTFIFAVVSRDKRVLLLSPLAILPDLDVFLGVHRGLLHSLLVIIPLTALFFVFLRNYYKYAAFFLFSHLFLDFLTGGVPFLYPLVNTGVGMEFPLVVKFGSALAIVEYLPRFIFTSPSPVHGQSFELISSFGIVLMLLFTTIYYWNGRMRDG